MEICGVQVRPHGDGTGHGFSPRRVPDGRALTITYDASIPAQGSGLTVSNSASLDGVEHGASDYNMIVNVEKIAGNGTGSTRTLTVSKVDRDNTDKKLEGAKFNYYTIIKNVSALAPTGLLEIGGTSYKVHQFNRDDDPYVTDENGSFKISEGLSPGYYYILEEVEPPAGYKKLEDPIVIYIGFREDVGKDSEEYAGGKLPDPDTVTAIAAYDLNVENVHEKGSLTIKKTVVKADGPAGIPEYFEFAINSPEDLDGRTFKATISSGETISGDGVGEDVTVTFTKSTAYVKLKGGQSITINELPTGESIL